MGREEEKKNRFLQDLDGALSGKEVGGMDDDYKSTIQFAKALAGMGPEPAQTFKSQLKARLMQKLTEQEEAREEKQGFFSWLGDIFRQPVWRAVTAVIVVIVAAGSIILATGILRGPEPVIVVAPPPMPAPAPSPAPTVPPSIGMQNPIVADASIARASYMPGELIDIDITLRNTGAQPLLFKPFPPIVSVLDAWTKKPVRTFMPVGQPGYLAPGESIKFPVNWDQRDDSGNPVPQGDYYIELEDVLLNERSSGIIFSKPAGFSISEKIVY